MANGLEALLAGGLVGYILGKSPVVSTEADIIKALREVKPQLVRNIAIDTSETRTLQEYPYSGHSIFVTNPEVPSLPVYIRLNEPDGEQVKLTAQRSIKAPFYRFFITNAAGSGILDIVVSQISILELAEAVTNINIVASTATVSIKVIAADIMLPVDIQASYIMMPIDIQSSYIMMPVDIQAQYVTLKIDIVAQTIGQLNVNIAAQTVGNIAINIAASAVTLQVNIASQTANLDINIAASAVQLNVNIAASAVQLNVNLAASAITLNVNIAASAVTLNVAITGTANIQITAKTVGVYLQTEWTALKGQDKRIEGSESGLNFNYKVSCPYTVPAGKTLYINCFTGACLAQTDVDGDKNQMCWGFLQVGILYLVNVGGNGGFVVTFPTPIVVNAGQTIDVYLINKAYHLSDGEVSIIGYEI